jgi:hypothetical protein
MLAMQIGVLSTQKIPLTPSTLISDWLVLQGA